MKIFKFAKNPNFLLYFFSQVFYVWLIYTEKKFTKKIGKELFSIAFQNSTFQQLVKFSLDK